MLYSTFCSRDDYSSPPIYHIVKQVEQMTDVFLVLVRSVEIVFQYQMWSYVSLLMRRDVAWEDQS